MTSDEAALIKARVEHYLALPYTYELTPDEAGWFIKIKELPGCMSQGDTVEEAMSMIREAAHLWLKTCIEDGDSIPEPGGPE